MTTQEPLLDTSWSIQDIPAGNRSTTLYNIFSRPPDHAARTQLSRLSEECQLYLSNQGPAYKDDLNDESERTGQLRECVVDQIDPFNTGMIRGLSIEARYQKTTFKFILLAKQELNSQSCPVVAFLYKASTSHLKYIKNWLDDKFDLRPAMPLQLPSSTILGMCAKFLATLDETFMGATDVDALRQATLKQVVGSLKLTIAFSAASGVAPQLRSMDFDIPADTVGMLLTKARERGQDDGLAEHGFLDELVKALHEKTGLILPLTDKEAHGRTSRADGADVSDARGQDDEPPLRVTKITCAAFALSVDGRLKLAGKPTQDAEVYGYEESVVQRAYLQLLQGVRYEAEKRQRDDA